MPKNILITGASTGIGRATAVRLARAGATVFAGVRTEADGKSLQAEQDSIVPLPLDVTDGGQIAAAAEQIEHAAGTLDALVNNAGIGVFAPLEFVPLDQLRGQFEVNVFGQVAVTQAMLPLLRQAPRARVVMIGSIADRITMPFSGPMCASKSAIKSINDALRMELKRWQIDLILIEPAAIKSDAPEKLERDAAAKLDEIGPEGRELYGTAYKNMSANFVKNARKGADPDVAAQVIQRAITARRPRTKYLVGMDSRMFAMAARLLPDRVLDALLLRSFGIS